MAMIEGMLFPLAWLYGEPYYGEEEPDPGEFCECEQGAPASRTCPVCGDPEFFDGTDLRGYAEF